MSGQEQTPMCVWVLLGLGSMIGLIVLADLARRLLTNQPLAAGKGQLGLIIVAVLMVGFPYVGHLKLGPEGFEFTRWVERVEGVTSAAESNPGDKSAVAELSSLLDPADEGSTAFAEASTVLARANLVLDRPEAAREHAEAALSVQPNLGKAKSLVKEAEVGVLIDEAREDPDSETIERRLELAAAQLQKARPTEPRARLALAEANLVLDRPDQALSLTKQVLAARPSMKPALQLKREAELPLLVERVEQNPGDAAARLNLQKTVDEVERSRPDLVASRLAVAKAQLALGNTEQARTEAMRILHAHPDLAEARTVLSAAEAPSH